MDADEPVPAADTPLYDVTFCVVDIETTGGSPVSSRITEIGAVKVRGGEVVGELAALVDPGLPIPPAITVLTGITDALVAGRPRFEAVLPAFLEFAAGTVLVAHNARFDTGFLRAALERQEYAPLTQRVVCTAALARRLLRDEVPDCRLATLARHLRARTRPVHRALADARATVDVLHALLERAGSFGVGTLEDLLEFARARNAPLFAARRHLADGLPAAPGVYRFIAEGGEVLYIGKASDLRRRVRTYFGGDDRRRIADLVRQTARIEHDVCPTPLEAEVAELRAIHAHLPRFNRRSRLPRSPAFVKLTPERYPRLALARVVRDDGGVYLGPLPSRKIAERIVDALSDAAHVRRCTDRIGVTTRLPACALAELGRCPAPCEGRVEPGAYAAVIAPVAQALTGDAGAAFDRLERRMSRLASAQRYAEAAELRRRAEALVAALRRARRAALLGDAGEVAACRRLPHAQVEVIAVRDGRLVGTASCPWETRAAAAGRLLADTSPAAVGVLTAAAEADLVARWLEQPGVVALHCSGPLAEPVAGGRALAAAEARLARARRGGADGPLAAKRLQRNPPRDVA